MDFEEWGRAALAFGRRLLGAALRLIFLPVPIVVGFALILAADRITGRPILANLAKEAGFAFLVASVIWAAFEFQLRSRSENEFTRRLEKIADNVFHAVLGANMPKDLVGEIHRVALHVRLVRGEMKARYLLEDATYKTKAGDTRAFVKLHSDKF